MSCSSRGCRFFFFNDTATTEIYTLSLHDALPISLGVDGDGGDAVFPGVVDQVPQRAQDQRAVGVEGVRVLGERQDLHGLDRKSTRLNSSHLVISYAVFCLKKKNTPESVKLGPLMA